MIRPAAVAISVAIFALVALVVVVSLVPTETVTGLQRLPLSARPARPARPVRHLNLSRPGRSTRIVAASAARNTYIAAATPTAAVTFLAAETPGRFRELADGKASRIFFKGSSTIANPKRTVPERAKAIKHPLSVRPNSLPMNAAGGDPAPAVPVHLVSDTQWRLENEDLPNPLPSMVVVTAASQNHFCPLWHLLKVLSEREAALYVVVYNLDLRMADRITLAMAREVNPRVIAVRRFDYARYPAFFDITNAFGSYSWKPVIIKRAVDEFGTALWMDAGNFLLWPNSLKDIYISLDREGFFSSMTQGSFLSWTHQGMLEYFDLMGRKDLLKEYNRRGNCNGAVVAFRNNTPAYSKLLLPWYQCALLERCIAPHGSNRANHRQDQAALTVLVHMNNYTTCQRKSKSVQLHQDRRPCQTDWHGTILQSQLISKSYRAQRDRLSAQATLREKGQKAQRGNLQSAAGVVQ